MTQFGYTAMGEQTPARQLITDLVAAEAAGFDFSVTSDHYFPWLEEQGHSPNAWAVLGAAAQATERLPLMTFVRRARELWRWALPGWHVMAELPDPRSFDAASQHVTEDDIAALVPCGPDTGQYVKAVREYVQAGFTHVALVQVGAEHQHDFIDWSARELLPALREL